MTKMNFSQFQQWARKTVQKQSDGKADADIISVEKLGKRYQGLLIRQRKSQIQTVIDLNRCYERYLSGEDLKERFREMTGDLWDREGDFTLEWLSDYQNIKTRLFIRLNNQKGNEGVLSNVPHTKIVDLALTYHIKIDLPGKQVGNTIITHEMLERFGITKEQLHNDAFDNASRLYPPCIVPLYTYMSSFGKQNTVAEDACMKRKAYIITNTKQIYGASVILYPGILENIGTLIGRDFYLLPSSIHEFIVCIADDENRYEILQEDVREVNERFVKKEEWLSDQVYHYDPETHVFELAEKFIPSGKKVMYLS